MRSQKTKQSPSKKYGRIWINALGILSAFVVAVGGLFLMQYSLDREKDKLLAGGGLVGLPQVERVETEETKDAFVLRQLTEDELFQLIQGMEHKGEIRPHEPLQGQLTMAQAYDCGLTWMEDFFLPHFGLSSLSDTEYRVDSYLWAPESGGSVEEYPWLSCWTVSFINQDIEAVLILSAVSGQVLDGAVTCSVPVPYQGKEDLLEALADYAFSFDLGEDCSIVYSGETESGAKRLPWYWSFGTRGIYAGLDASSTRIVTDAVEDIDTGEVNYVDREYFKVRLFLCLEPEIP